LVQLCSGNPDIIPVPVSRKEFHLIPGNCRSSVIFMKCYVCAKEGKDSDAVAVCIACGMGTCMKHTIRKEVDVWEGSYPLPSRKLPRKMPRMLCPDCNAALGDGK
jgi:hypothetical protein